MASKLLLVALLTFSGLICPSHLAEALRCYQCGNDGTCNGSNQRQVECQADANGCFISRDPLELAKACGIRDAEFDCVQKELGQSGDCVKGSESEMVAAFDKCGITNASPTSDGKVDVLTILHLMVNQESVSQIRQGNAYAVCICTGNLCNTEDLLGGGSGGGGEDSGATGQMVGAVTMVSAGLFVLMTGRLF